MNRIAPLGIFQSTLSVRRATSLNKTIADLKAISIHALREESDITVCHAEGRNRSFQSTLSVRRATVAFATINGATPISIHALREESDSLG